MAKFDSPWGEITTHILSGHLWRVVESQEEIATVRLVDDLDEQILLEDMLDNCKPSPPENATEWDYLLFTPFRYPPLQWGSRFGNTHERGMFYASETLDTALAEVAYYRFVFWTGMSIPLSNPLHTQHTAFLAAYHCSHAVDLLQQPFAAHQAELTSPDSYHFTQQVGNHLRKNDCDGIRFESARCPDNGVNLVITVPGALKRQRPNHKHHIACITTTENVSFKVLHPKPTTLQTAQHFPKSSFTVDGSLPIAT